jgi:hypothetical protein
MKKLAFLISFPAIFTFIGSPNELTEKERKDAVSYFNETLQDLEKEINGLSEKQLNWKPADSIWNVTECVEHIALAEKNLFERSQVSLKEPANPVKRNELKMDDEAVKKLITDRSNKFKTREVLNPTGQFGGTRKAFEFFKDRRTGLIQYVKETKDDLRNHFVELSVGLVDNYQLLLFISGHTRRHTLQIAELKSMPGFPQQ